MSVLFAMKVYESLVLAADSAVTVSTAGNQQRANVYNGANKIVNLYKGLPVAAAYCGIANMGAAPMDVVLKNYRAKLYRDREADLRLLRGRLSICSIVHDLRRYLHDIHAERVTSNAAEQPLAVIVGSIAADQQASELWQIIIEPCGNSPDPVQLVPPEEFDVYCGGDKEAFTRILHGIGESAALVLSHVIKDAAQRDGLLEGLLAASEVGRWNKAMPIQDAIDFVEFLADLSCRFARFRRGHETVGGPIDIATITRHEGFKWVRRKLYYPPELNPPVREWYDE